MRKLPIAAALAAALVLIAGASVASAHSADAESEGTLQTLHQPKPAWLTNELEAEIIEAGPEGLEVNLGSNAKLEPNCLGTAPPYVGTDGVSTSAVSAGTCMVSPHG